MSLLAQLGRHSEGRLLVHRIETSGRPLPLGLALRALCRGPVYLEDSSGRRRKLTVGQLARWIGAVALEPLRVRALLRKVDAAVAALENVRNVEPSRIASSHAAITSRSTSPGRRFISAPTSASASAPADRSATLPAS